MGLVKKPPPTSYVLIVHVKHVWCFHPHAFSRNFGGWNNFQLRMQQNDQIVEPQERRLRSDSATLLTGREAKGADFLGGENW